MARDFRMPEGMNRLLISFSGGRTSAYMAKRLIDELPSEVERIVVFANTGQEHPATLEFVDKCDREFGLGLVWLEAKVDLYKGVGTSFNVVGNNSASTDGSPFEAMIAKFGVPNTSYPHCTRELKERPMTAYARSLGWGPTSKYCTAIGIRVDEIDRMSTLAKSRNWLYPLIRWEVRKTDVLAWWREQSFDLRIPEHLGNCTWCWKKSYRKHLTLARDFPEVFDFPKRMEATYPFAGPGVKEGPRRFFRGNRSAEDILREARDVKFEPFVDGHNQHDPIFDVGGGCEESCEVFSE